MDALGDLAQLALGHLIELDREVTIEFLVLEAITQR